MPTSGFQLPFSESIAIVAKIVERYCELEPKTYCDTMLTAAPKTITNRFQRVFNAAARVVSGSRKFDRGLSQLLHSKLHWLDIPQRVQYKLGSHSSPVSAEQGSSVPDGLLHACIWRVKPPTPSRIQSSPVNGSTTPSQHIWSSYFLRCGTDGMELASTLAPGPCSKYRRIQIGAENSSFCGAKGRLAH